MTKKLLSGKVKHFLNMNFFAKFIKGEMLRQFVLAKVRLISILLSFTGLTDCQAARRGDTQTDKQTDIERPKVSVYSQTDRR